MLPVRIDHGGRLLRGAQNSLRFMTYVVSEKFPEKEALIRSCRHAPVLAELGIETMIEIARTSDKLLKKAADAGTKKTLPRTGRAF